MGGAESGGMHGVYRNLGEDRFAGFGGGFGGGKRPNAELLGEWSFERNRVLSGDLWDGARGRECDRELAWSTGGPAGLAGRRPGGLERRRFRASASPCNRILMHMGTGTTDTATSHDRR